MKKTISMLLMLVVFSSASNAQTTQEEYNYLTKGYKIQVESGLDMKKGYYFDDLIETKIVSNTGLRQSEFKALYREGQTMPCAVLCIYKNVSNNFVSYICLPTYNSDTEIWSQFSSDLVQYKTTDIKDALIHGFSYLSSYYFSGRPSKK